MLARTLPKTPIFFNPGISLRAADLAKLLLRAEWLAKGCGSTAAHAYAGLETSRQGPHLVAAVIGGRSCSTMRAHLRHAAHGPQPSGTSPRIPQVFPELGLSRPVARPIFAAGCKPTVTETASRIDRGRVSLNCTLSPSRAVTDV
jgi:hypothetical protein